MIARLLVVLVGVGFLAGHAPAQNVLFDFENAAVYSPFPIDLTVGGITAHFSATGQGYSIQSSSTVAIVPAGFSGHFIYPSSVYAADLLVSFSQTLTNFSILYAPQELGCDDSARMKVTAYMDSTPVGTNTTTASSPGTYPSETLSITTALSFNNVVVHYDARPPTCQDYGPIFLADNLSVSLAPPPIVLNNLAILADGTFQFDFPHPPGGSFSALAATNLSVPLNNWTNLGGVTEVLAGQYQFRDAQATNYPQRYYRVRSR
jgi:hypothetical protein